jgi:hypothetical protein
MVVHSRSKLAASVAFLCTLLLTSSAFATSVLKVDVSTHLLDSTAVVQGVVGEAVQGQEAEGGRPYTDTRIRVDRVLWGSAPAEISIRQPKGTIGDTHFGISGDGDLRSGDKVVIFVSQGSGFHVLAALGQSVYRVKGSGPEASIEQQLDGLVFFTRDEHGAIVPLEKLTPGPKTVAAMEAALKAATEGR